MNLNVKELELQRDMLVIEEGNLEAMPKLLEQHMVTQPEYDELKAQFEESVREIKQRIAELEPQVRPA